MNLTFIPSSLHKNKLNTKLQLFLVSLSLDFVAGVWCLAKWPATFNLVSKTEVQAATSRSARISHSADSGTTQKISCQAMLILPSKVAYDRTEFLIITQLV